MILTTIFGILLLTVAFGRSMLFTFLTDMANQVSLKPFEAPGITTLPIGAVNIEGLENRAPSARFSWLDSEAQKQNWKGGLKTISASVKGNKSFDAYCLFCHGNSPEANPSGLAKTKMNEVGMMAPALNTLTPFFSDDYLNQKISNGGTIMPPLGHAIMEKERLEIIAYLRSLEPR